jgi:hypothetical protein
MIQTYTEWRALTPSDTATLVKPTRALWVGGAGDVAAVRQDGSVGVFVAVPAGSWLPIAVWRVNATGTTATSLMALYQV